MLQYYIISNLKSSCKLIYSPIPKCQTNNPLLFLLNQAISVNFSDEYLKGEEGK